jgi:hypothetical protein
MATRAYLFPFLVLGKGLVIFNATLWKRSQTGMLFISSILDLMFLELLAS